MPEREQLFHPSESRYVCGWCGAEFDHVHKPTCLYAGERVKRWQTREETR